MPIDVVKADKTYRDLVLLLYALVTLLGVVAAKWLIPMGLGWLYSMAWHELFTALRWLFVVVLVLPAPAAVYLIVVGRRTIAHDCYPYPGRKVMFDTPVLRGRRARTRGRMLIGLGALFLVLMVACMIYTVIRYTLWLNNPLFKKYLYGESAVVAAPRLFFEPSATESPGPCPSTSSTARTATPSTASSRAA